MKWASNIYCDHCWQQPLEGPHMKCLNCDDYDLCMKCDGLNDAAIASGQKPIHPVGHVLVKLRPSAEKPEIVGFSF
jgi:hypothetical protein